MALWSKTFTQIDTLNNGNEFTINDYPTAQGFNVPINNTQFLYDLLDNGFLKSFVLSQNKITITATSINGVDTTYTFDASDIGGAMASDLVDVEKVAITGSYNPNTMSVSLNATPTTITNYQHKAMLLLQNVNSAEDEEITKFYFKKYAETYTDYGEYDNYYQVSVFSNELYDIIVESNTYFASTVTITKSEIAQRLDDLGFKTGVVTTTDFTISDYTLIKQGQMALLTLRSNQSSSFIGGRAYTLTIPNDFTPQTQQRVLVRSGSFVTFGSVNTNGTITYYPEQTGSGGVNIDNAGWKIN